MSAKRRTNDAADQGLDIVAFPSGYGDGAFGTWLGIDEDGRAVAVLTDFGVLDAASIAQSPAGSPAR